MKKLVKLGEVKSGDAFGLQRQRAGRRSAAHAQAGPLLHPAGLHRGPGPCDGS